MSFLALEWFAWLHAVQFGTAKYDQTEEWSGAEEEEDSGGDGEEVKALLDLRGRNT